jgi:hypothetical protein
VVTGFPWRVEITAKLDEMNSRAKITAADLCLGIFISLPQRVDEEGEL